MVDFVGLQLGNYHLLRLLGQGAYAAVYLGEHQYLERPAAVKVLHIQMAPSSHEAFRREARTIARLDHPHIIGVYDFGIEGQIPYLVMEYMPNGTLRTQHPKGTLLPFEKILDYVKQIASALDYAHEQKVIHRDIKPENILLNTRHEVVLSDFGIAVVQPTLDSLSLQSAVGTPLYMAPEQIQGQPCAASDQYALGVMVYEWLCGEPPFRGPSTAVFLQHLHDQPPSLCVRLPHLSPAVEDVVMGALAKDPQRRFSCVQDFALMLEDAFFATQTLSLNEPAEGRSLDQSARSATRATSSMPVPSTSEEEYSNEPTQPRMKTVQRIGEDHERVARVSPPPTARSQTFSVMCVCAPEDKAYLTRWETHLRPLEQAGYLIVWSEQHLLAGTDRVQQINAHLEQADLIVLLLSADFFDSNECIALMEQALRRYQHGAAHLIPLLLRPVEWQESPLAPLSCIPSNQLPVTEWTNQDAAFGECVREIRQILDPTASTRIVEPPPPSALQNRLRLLRRVRSFWITGLLEQSLHGAALMALELKELPDAVANPWHLMLYSPDRTPRPLPAGMRITQVYDNADGELLILGAPGSGKTTLLLELARDLLLQAEHNARLPMPVVFNLSSWSLKQQRLTAWLVDELNSKYLVPRKLAQVLIETDQILPLLDGLDEVVTEERTACIEAINTYRLEHGLRPLVVCSRSADYLAQAARVRLANAVMVQPLTPRQVLAYLSTTGSRGEALCTALQLDSDLQVLATTPLMLNILILAYQGMPLNQIAPLGTLPVKQQQIFATYVQRMLTRRSATTRYIPKQTLPWLGFLAQKMKQRGQTVFYIEHMQPDWLIDKCALRTYDWLAVRLPYMLVGMLVGFAPYLLFSSDILTSFLSEVILLGGLLGWLLSGGGIAQQPLGNGGKARGMLWYWFLQQLGLATLLGSGAGLSFWLSDYDPLHGLVAGLSFAVCCLLLMLLLRKNDTLQVPLQPTPRRRPSRGTVVFNTLLVGLLAGLSSALGPDLHTELKFRVADGLLFLLLGGLSGGLLSMLMIGRHAAVQPADRLTWTWQSFGRSLFSVRHIRSALQITGIGLLLFSAIGWALGGTIAAIPVRGLLLFGSICGLCSWLLFSFFRGVESTTIDDRLRVVPNQGIHRSALNALRYGLIVAIIVGLGGRLLFSTSWLSSLMTGLSVGLLAGLFNGGLACLRHSILRILLWRSGAIPWDYPHFLDAVAERLLLRKVGGGYIFLHRLLLDYLATLRTDDLAEQKNAIPSHPITFIDP